MHSRPDMQSRANNAAQHPAEQGFMLVGLIVAIFLILLALSVAAPTIAKQLRREREVEAVHRGNQYVRAIRQYYIKTGHYPGSMEQLEKTSNVRFLRQRFVDPMTGKADWKLIHVGEAKTTVKAFFGQPLAGIAGSSGGLGSAAGLASSGQGGQSSVNGAGSSSSSFGSSSFGSSSFGSSSSGSSSFGGSSSSPGSSGIGSSSGPGSSSSGSSSFGASSGSSGSSTPGSPGVSSQSATSLTGTGAPIMGVGSAATGTSIVVLNEQTTYPAWEFIYDPRIEQLKAKSNSLGGSLGSASSSASGFGSSATGLGQGTGSGFGGSNGTSAPGGTGSGFSAPGAQTPSTPPQ